MAILMSSVIRRLLLVQALQLLRIHQRITILQPITSRHHPTPAMRLMQATTQPTTLHLQVLRACKLILMDIHHREGIPRQGKIHTLGKVEAGGAMTM